MSLKPSRDRGRASAALFATAYILVIGLGACLFIVFAAADQATATKMAALSLAVASTIWFLFWLLRDRRSNQSSLTNIVWLGRKERRSNDFDYKPRLRKRRRSRETTGTNQPPTVERIRELSDNVKTWVPSRSRAEKHRRDHQDS